MVSLDVKHHVYLLTFKPFGVLFKKKIFFALACERTLITTHSLESRCYKTRKYTVCRHVHASFCPEIVQAGAVKGLIVKAESMLECVTLKCCTVPVFSVDYIDYSDLCCCVCVTSFARYLSPLSVD